MHVKQSYGNVLSMQKIIVKTTNTHYPIYIGSGLRHQTDLILNHITGEQVLIVTNQTIANIYLNDIHAVLTGTGKIYHDLILPDGEQYKNFDSLTLIFDALLNYRYPRNCTLIALGGGVIGDMTGFAAACYQRGVNFIQIPTTLLAQVDASIGGKTGVNYRMGKNMIGAFHQPECVIVDINTLNTLAAREFHAGLAEVIKHALIVDNNFWNWLVDNLNDVLIRDVEALQSMILQCCNIKAGIVEKDEKERGKRAILNFGHTFAHAIESGCGYGVYLHGEAVAMGMMMATELSVLLGTLEHNVIIQLQQLLERCELPTKISHEFSNELFWQHVTLDKKASDQQLRFITLNGIGNAQVVQNIPKKMVEQALNSWRA